MKINVAIHMYFTMDASDLWKQLAVIPGFARVKRSYASFCAEKYRHYMQYPFTIHPLSKIRLCMDFFFVISILFCYTILPLYCSQNFVNLSYHVFILYVTDALTIVNIVGNCFTGYVEGYTSQYVVLDLKKIFWRYSKTWLLIDLMCAMSSVPRLFNVKGIFYQLILVSLKILRIPILFRYVSNINAAVRVGILVQTCIELFLCMYLFLMWNIYFQFALEYMAEGSYTPVNPRNCSWITMANLWNKTTLERFVYSFHRAVGMLRKNSNLNLINEECYFENFYMIAWFIAKLLVYHCGLKYIVAVFGAQSAASKYSRMRKQIEMYIHQRKFPPRIKEKILKFYAIRFQSTFFVEERILPYVSGQLREDIIMHTGRQLVRELEFMKRLPRTLLLQISFQLKLVVFIAGDIIFKINSIGDCLYFIDKGTVAVYSESGKEVCHLEDGDFFGEIALVMRHRLRTASVVAVSNCELFRLDRNDFDNSIACYPTVYEHVKEVATHRYERTCVLDERYKTEMRNVSYYKKQKL